MKKEKTASYSGPERSSLADKSKRCEPLIQTISYSVEHNTGICLMFPFVYAFNWKHACTQPLDSEKNEKNNVCTSNAPPLANRFCH